jgi:hypothetical protein
MANIRLGRRKIGSSACRSCKLFVHLSCNGLHQESGTRFKLGIRSSAVRLVRCYVQAGTGCTVLLPTICEAELCHDATPCTVLSACINITRHLRLKLQVLAYNTLSPERPLRNLNRSQSVGRYQETASSWPVRASVSCCCSPIAASLLLALSPAYNSAGLALL